MNNNDNQSKINQEIQATSDEATRLLKKLESRTQSQEKKDIAPIEASAPPSPLGGRIMLAGLIGLGGLIILAGQIVESSRRITDTQKDFYFTTLNKADQAILKREHEIAIKGLSLLKASPYSKFKEVNQRLVQNKIDAANKKIKFLDQPGKMKYWEDANYGYQWFDKHGDEGFRIFFAFSRRCKIPLITFRFSRNDNGPVLKRYRFTPKTYTSTILIPYMLEGHQYIGIESFKCN